MLYHCYVDKKHSNTKNFTYNGINYASLDMLLLNENAKIHMYIDLDQTQINVLDNKYYLSMVFEFFTEFKGEHLMTIAFLANTKGDIKPVSSDYFNKKYTYVKTHFGFDLFDVFETENPYLKQFKKNLENIKHFQLYKIGL